MLVLIPLAHRVKPLWNTVCSPLVRVLQVVLLG